MPARSLLSADRRFGPAFGALTLAAVSLWGPQATPAADAAIPPSHAPSAQPLAGVAGDPRLTSSECAAFLTEPPPANSAGSPWPKLTGDWFGCRDAVRDRGVTLDVSTTQFYQGVASGGLERSFPYGGRNDYFVTLDGEKLGLWQGVFVKVHGETRYGESASYITGALSPVNEYLGVPGSEGVVSGITGAKVTQFLSENTLLIAGKINLLDEVIQPLTGATGLEGFQNVSLIFNPILARTLTYSAFGAGGLYVKNGHPVFALSVFDTRDASTTSVFDDLFTNGAAIFSTVILPTRFFGRPGHQGLEAVYSSGRYTNVSKSPYLDPIGDLVFPGAPKAGSWAVAYLFDQAVWVSPDDPKRMWGVFGRLGLSDGNPNPIRWTAGGGVSGASPIPGRTRDTFGVGFYHLEVSDALKRSARPLTPLRNEQGVELYYNARVTPWFQFTPDLQVIEPFQKNIDTAIVVGFRAKVDF